MEKKFLYLERTGTFILVPVVLGIACILFAVVKPGDIIIDDLLILASPTSTFVLLVMGLLLIGIPFFFYARKISSQKIDQTINIYPDSFTYPSYSDMSAVKKDIFSKDVDMICERSNNPSNQSLVIYTPINKGFQRFDCKKNCFENKDKYNEFKSILMTKCNNIKIQFH